MAEQSHRDEMSAAIRERRAAPRSIAPEPLPVSGPEQEPEPPVVRERKSLFARLRGK